MKTTDPKREPLAENLPATFGGWLRYYRERTEEPRGKLMKRLSLERMAHLVSEALGTIDSPTYQTVSNWENNRSQVKQDDRNTLMALLKVLNRFAAEKGLRTPEQADQALEQGGYRPLNREERLAIFGQDTEDEGTPFGKLTPPVLQRPPDIQHFVGRIAELQYFREKLQREKLAIITGIPGVGKTALAARLSRRVPPEHVFWHSFHEGEEAWSLIWKLAAFLAWRGKPKVWELIQSQQAGGQIPVEGVMDYLAQQLGGAPYLFCLDDFHFIDEDRLVPPLLARLRRVSQAGELALLITSRRKPAFLHEVKADVLEGLSEADVRRWAQTVGVSASEETLGRLAHATAGNAQFLILALNALPALSQRREFLEQIIRSADVVSYLLDAVHKHLSEPERQVMRAASILLGYPITFAALEYLLDMEDLPNVVVSLHRRALLVQDGETGGRFSQHILIRTFYYNSIAPGKRTGWHRKAGSFHEKEEQDDFLAALHFARAGDAEQVVRLVTRDDEALLNRGQARALAAMLSGLDLGALAPATQARARLALGYAQARLDDNQAAVQNYHQVLAILETQPSSPASQGLKAMACQRLAEVFRYDSPPQALEWLRRGLTFLDEARPSGGASLDAPSQEAAQEAAQDVRALLYIKIGSVQNTIGDYEAAREATQQGLVLLSETPSHARASAYLNLGTIYALRGDLQTGNIWTRRGLAMCEYLGNKFYQLTALYNLAIYNFTGGNWAEAIQDAASALEMAEELGSPIRQAEGALILGTMYLKRGDYPAGKELLQKSESLSRKYGLRENLPYVLNSRADLALRLGREEETLKLLEDAEQIAVELDARVQLPETHRLRALARLAQGDLPAAQEQIEQSLHVAEEMEMDLEAAMSRRVQGQILAKLGQRNEALARFQESLEALEKIDPYEAAVAQMHWGFTLREHRAEKQGDALLHAAHEKFVQLGAQAELALLEPYL